jgi:hypothetical protein
MPLYDEHGLPKDVGASDWQDSCRLAGIMAISNHPKAPNMRLYLNTEGEGLRCPKYPPADNPKNFSRDQLVLLSAGLRSQQIQATHTLQLYAAAISRKYRAQNSEHDYPGTVKKFPDGPDILMPSVMNHLRLCAGLSGFFMGYVNLVLDIMINAAFTPMREPNQLVAMCVVAGPKYVRLYKRLTPKWREAFREYWSGWRGESELAEHIVAFLEKY